MKLGKLEIVVEESKEDTVKHLAKDLNIYLAQLKAEGNAVLFLSSGGSSLSVLDYIQEDLFGEYLTVGVLDERYESTTYDKTTKNNNFSQLVEMDFYEKAKRKSCRFIDTRMQLGQTQAELAKYFEHELRKWREENPNGKIVVTAGAGADGHTAGIAPVLKKDESFKNLFEGSQWVAGYEAIKDRFPSRVTTTITFFHLIDRVFVLMLGKEKSDTFLLVQKEGSMEDIPARIWKEIDGAIYVDESVIKS